MRALLLVTLLAAGCTKDVTKDFEDLADKACACAEKQDRECGKTVLADVAKLAEESRNVKGNEQRAAAAAKRLGECLLKAKVTSLEIAETINQIPKKEDPSKPKGSGSAEAPAPPAP